jgi:hypothetical protein
LVDGNKILVLKKKIFGQHWIEVTSVTTCHIDLVKRSIDLYSSPQLSTILNHVLIYFSKPYQEMGSLYVSAMLAQIEDQ